MAAIIAPPHIGSWQRQSGQAMHAPADMPPLFTSYGPSRSVTNPPGPQAYPTTTHLDMGMPLFTAPVLATSVPYQPGTFALESITANPYNLQQSFPVSYTSGLPHAVSYPGPVDIPHVSPARKGRSRYQTERTTPVVKAETRSPVSQNPTFECATVDKDVKPPFPEDGSGRNSSFSTPVDVLVRGLQAHPLSPHQEEEEKTETLDQKSKKKYRCDFENCDASFPQKQHLATHRRSHTGERPFICQYPSCGEGFSQLGNLKSHMNRHTGKRPYKCPFPGCGKTFPQKGALYQHNNVHSKEKPFECRLDDCGKIGKGGKPFSQLGNLKQHHNKFHAATIQYLTHKFANVSMGDQVTEQEQELWAYFTKLYKNSNKGIKGRGKGRRVAKLSSANASTNVGPAVSSPQDYSSSYEHSGSDRSSRSSSTSLDSPRKIDNSYGFSPTMPDAFPGHAHAYSDAVFPERQMY